MTERPKIGILMGSDSDWPTMRKAYDVAGRFGVPAEVRVLSAHRRPADTADYAASADQRGLAVLIAGAGLAAHLPGVLAAHTRLPVIGVPIESKLDGLDALLSIVQMPPGVPVATVGIGRADNAALLAVEILALADEGLAARLSEYKRELVEQGRAADERVQESLARE